MNYDVPKHYTTINGVQSPPMQRGGHVAWAQRHGCRRATIQPPCSDDDDDVSESTHAADGTDMLAHPHSHSHAIAVN